MLKEFRGKTRTIPNLVKSYGKRVKIVSFRVCL